MIASPRIPDHMIRNNERRDDRKCELEKSDN